MAGALLGTIGLLFRVSEVFRFKRRMVRAVRGEGEVPFTKLVVTTLSSVRSNRRMVRAVRGDASAMVRVVVGELF